MGASEVCRYVNINPARNLNDIVALQKAGYAAIAYIRLISKYEFCSFAFWTWFQRTIVNDIGDMIQNLDEKT